MPHDTLEEYILDCPSLSADEDEIDGITYSMRYAWLRYSDREAMAYLADFHASRSHESLNNKEPILWRIDTCHMM